MTTTAFSGAVTISANAPRLPEPSHAEYRVAGLQAGDAGADLHDSGEVVPHRLGME